MTAALRPQISACPACLAAPAAEALAARAAAPVRGDVVLSLPGIHCAACISGVEHHLTEIPGVHGARVNLTKKRVTIDTDGTLEPADLVSVLTAAGYEAHELDATALSATQT
ncbi:MAG: cation transporter, partial [Paracoccaceae bacterium]